MLSPEAVEDFNVVAGMPIISQACQSQAVDIPLTNEMASRVSEIIWVKDGGRMQLHVCLRFPIICSMVRYSADRKGCMNTPKGKSGSCRKYSHGC